MKTLFQKRTDSSFVSLKKYLNLQDQEQSLKIIHKLVPEWKT